MIGQGDRKKLRGTRVPEAHQRIQTFFPHLIVPVAGQVGLECRYGRDRPSSRKRPGWLVWPSDRDRRAVAPAPGLLPPAGADRRVVYSTTRRALRRNTSPSARNVKASVMSMGSANGLLGKNRRWWVVIGLGVGFGDRVHDEPGPDHDAQDGDAAENAHGHPGKIAAG